MVATILLSKNIITMNRQVKHNAFSKITAWLLCLLFVVQLANNAVFTHTHITADGQLISHAHPFNKGSDSEPVKSHHHSDFEIGFFQQLNLLFLSSPILVALFIAATSFKYFKRRIQKNASGFLQFLPGRSPPCIA